MITARWTYFDHPLTAACDERCDKAWGMMDRPHVVPDDHESPYVADDDLGDAPTVVGSWEGRHTKPATPEDRLNKWCVRACERCWWSPLGEPDATPVLPVFNGEG